MKKLLLLTLCLVSIFTANAQSRLVVAPGVGTLEAAINADSTNRPADRVYVLRRNAPYIVNGTITNWTLRLEAEAGTGSRPLIAYSAQGGVVLNQIFEARGNIECKNIAFTARDLLNGTSERVMAISADNVRVRLDSCFADDIAQSFFRVNNAGFKCYVTNSVISRVGDPKNPNNGRFIDKRGPSMDTVVIENCVIYNVTSRIIRDAVPANANNHIRINQNTFWGTGEFCISPGKVKDFVVTNNIFQNCAIFGASATAVTPTAALEPDTTALGKNWTISNNNFSRNPEVIAVLPARIRIGTGTQSTVANSVQAANYNALASAVAQNTFTELITFRNPPVLPDYLVTDNRGDTTNTTSVRNNARPWDHTKLTKDATYSALGTPPIDRFSTAHDFGYGTWRPAFRNGTAGQPLGARLFQPTTSVSNYFDASGVMAYPNPVSEILYMAGMDKAKINRIEVVSITGQAVQSFNTEGASFLQIPTQTMSNGVYFLKITNNQYAEICKAIS